MIMAKVDLFFDEFQTEGLYCFFEAFNKCEDRLAHKENLDDFQFRKKELCVGKKFNPKSSMFPRV